MPRPKNYDRLLQALELRKRGQTYDRIAKQMGYRDAGGAYKAVHRAIAEAFREPTDAVKRLEVERLDALLASMWDKAMGGSTWHVDRCLSIMDRRARLLGLDAPQRKIVNVITEDVIDAEIRRLEEELAGNDGPQAGRDVRA